MPNKCLCKGNLVEIKTILDYRGYKFNNVLAQRCTKCGEVVLHSSTLEKFDDKIDRIEKNLANVKATMDFEGMNLPDDVVEIYRKVSFGEITEDEAIKTLLSMN